MNRRNFIKASAATAGLAGFATAPRLLASHHKMSGRLFFELRKYVIENEWQKRTVGDFLSRGAIPALNRLGHRPIGVFEEMASADDHSITVVTPYHSIDEFLALPERLAEDQAFLGAAETYLSTEKAHPAYARIETSFFHAFEGFPGLEAPINGERMFEIRIYESHNEVKARLKVEMFNEGEIDIFKDVKLPIVFFGEAIIGSHLPNLTYMLAYRDKAHHKEVWDAFRVHPEWKRMSAMDRYKDTVSKIHNRFLLPGPGSQV